MAGLLHDVGYLDVDDSIFAKDEQPTDEEWDELASHAERGARILSRCGFGEIAEWVRHHHERIDGDGYPDGLEGDADPARVPHPARRRRLRGHDARPQLPAPYDRRAALAELERLPARSSTPVASRRCGGRQRRLRLPERERYGVDRDVARLGRDARDPGADRGEAPGRSRPPRPHACSRRARCRRCSDARRRGSADPRQVAFERRERPVAAHVQRGQPVGMLLGAARVLDRSARRRCSARSRTARRNPSRTCAAS